MTPFPVAMEQTGGEDGSSTEQASWVYSIRKLHSDAIIRAGVDPGALPHHYRRPNLGRMETADFGLAMYDAGELIVLDTNEIWIASTC